jgi:Flp pilus assembly protein TadD
LALLTACSRPKEPPVTRIAILPCENLTGDPSLDWMASSASTILAAELTGVPKILAVRVQSVSDGYLGKTARFVHSYFTGKPGNVHFQVEIEDAARHKIDSAVTSEGDLLAAMNQAAKHIDAAAQSFSTSNPEAVAAWGHGEYERAVNLDPDFGAAWLAWMETLIARGDPAKALEIGDKLSNRNTLKSQLDVSRIAFLRARVGKDPAAANQALARVAREVRTDPSLYEALGEAEMKARDYAAAAAAYSKIIELDPENGGALNSLGYADAFAGNLDGARGIFEDYGRQPSQKPNSLDSLGEVYFMRGKFTEAEKYFLDAHQANPAFLAGGDLMKAAYAHWLAHPGDQNELKAADALMARYLDFRRNQKDQLIGWREASWLYATGLFATGRRDLALTKLTAVPNPQIVAQQTALWNGKIELSHDLAALKQRFDNTAPAADSQVRVLYAAALIAADRKDEARPLLEMWPMPWAPGDAVLESWVLPKFIELRQAIGATGK